MKKTKNYLLCINKMLIFCASSLNFHPLSDVKKRQKRGNEIDFLSLGKHSIEKRGRYCQK